MGKMSTQRSSDAGSSVGLLERQGIARHLLWGFVAVIVFQTGNGMELGFLNPFLSGRGLSGAQISALFTAYGIVVAIASWFSGALADSWGPRRVMLTGLVSWLVFEVIFLAGGVATGNFAVMIIAYALRGFGYPLFAFGFLAWVTMDTPEETLGRGVGWFWFAQALGLGVASAYIPILTIPLIGQLATLWLSIAFVIIGGLVAIFLLKPAHSGQDEKRPTASDTLGTLLRGITILKDHPKVGIGGIVRIINQAAYYGIPVFFVSYMVKDVGMSQGSWQTVWGTLNLANVFANLVFGYVGDKFGRVRTVAWFGGLGCAASVLLMYYLPTAIGPSMWASLVPAILFGIALAAFVPLSAIMPMLAPERKGSAVAILNLGAGLSNFVGPAFVFLQGGVGVVGLIWIFSMLHVLGFFLTFALNPSSGSKNADTGKPSVSVA